MAIAPVVSFEDIESGINSGFALSINVDGITLEIGNGEFRISRYDGSRVNVFQKSASNVLPGQDLGTFPDLNSVVPSQPPLTGNETVIFFLIAENNVIYQTGVSPLSGEIIRNYLTLGAAQLDNIVDRNITNLFNFKNINASQYEFSNALGPITANVNSLNLTGNANMTISSSSGAIWFSGSNFDVSNISPNEKKYAAQDPIPFLYVFQYNDGSFFFSSTTITDLSIFEGLYDDGTVAPGGTLPTGNLNNNNWTIDYIFFEVSLGQYIYLIGQTEYNNLNRIRDALFEDTEIINVPLFLDGVQNKAYCFRRGNADSLDPDDGRFYIQRFNPRFFQRV